DAEARALEDALATDAALDTVIATGVAGACPTCGTLASTSARFCANCGTALDGRPDAAHTTEPPAANGDGTTPVEAELESAPGGTAAGRARERAGGHRAAHAAGRGADLVRAHAVDADTGARERRGAVDRRHDDAGDDRRARRLARRQERLHGDPGVDAEQGR